MKKYFPGVNPKEVAKRKIVNATSISESTFVDEKGIHSTDDLHSVYVRPYNEPKFNFKLWLLSNLNVNILLLFCWFTAFIGVHDYEQPVRAMFDNVYNQKPKEQSDICSLGIDMQNKPLFSVNLSIALAFMLVSTCILLRSYRKDKRNSATRYANENATVDLMLAIKSIKEAGKKVKLNVTDETAKKLIEICPYIISRMSADERIYFDMLIDGDIESTNEEMFKNFALAVMDGHLSSNPKDLQMVLAAFDETSIAVLLSNMYRQNTILLYQQKPKTK